MKKSGIVLIFLICVSSAFSVEFSESGVVYRNSVRYHWAEFGTLYGFYLLSEEGSEFFVPLSKQSASQFELPPQGGGGAPFLDEEGWKKVVCSKRISFFPLKPGVYLVSQLLVNGEKQPPTVPFEEIMISENMVVYLGDWFKTSSSIFPADYYQHLSFSTSSVLVNGFISSVPTSFESFLRNSFSVKK